MCKTPGQNYLEQKTTHGYQGSGAYVLFGRNLGHMPTWALLPLARNRMKSFGQYSIMLRARAGSKPNSSTPPRTGPFGPGPSHILSLLVRCRRISSSAKSHRHRLAQKVRWIVASRDLRQPGSVVPNRLLNPKQLHVDVPHLSDLDPACNSFCRRRVGVHFHRCLETQDSLRGSFHQHTVLRFSSGQCYRRLS